jgi:cytochrome c556
VWGLLALFTLLCPKACAESAHEPVTLEVWGLVEARDFMGTFAAIAKKQQPFDAEVVKASAEKMAEHLANAAELFPEGSAEGDVQSWSKPEIWTDRERFDEIFESARLAAVEMQSVTEISAFMPALGKIGNGCKSCHELYRIPKE